MLRHRPCPAMLLLAVALACAPPDDPASLDTAAPAAATVAPTLGPVEGLIDTSIAPAIAGADGWNYRQASDADLTGDGLDERVVLTARVELVRGRPAWDDGQPWQVYVEHQDSSRVYLYAQRLQLGTLTLRVTRGDSTAAPTVLLLEHLPDRLRVIELGMTDAARPSIKSLFERALDPRGESAGPRLP
jgi:hypothetical protein